MRDVTAHDASDVAADLDALFAKGLNLPGPRCGVTVAVAAILEARPELGERVTEAIDSKDVSTTDIAAFLSKHSGHMVKPPTVRRHRARNTAVGCSCR